MTGRPRLHPVPRALLRTYPDEAEIRERSAATNRRNHPIPNPPQTDCQKPTTQVREQKGHIYSSNDQRVFDQHSS